MSMKIVKPNTKPIAKSLSDAGKRIVGIQKAANYAGVSRWTVRTWLDEGKLPFVKYPGRGDADLRGAKIDLDDMDAFIERSKDRHA